jgi:FtsP/CotA-like multicopper oxidase with cupredoxin domain
MSERKASIMSGSRALGVILLVAAVAALIGPGTAAAGPIGMVCQNGTTFNLTARGGYVETPDGNAAFMWGYAPTGGSFQMPGPVLCVNEGAVVTVNLHNALNEPVSIVFPGQRSVSSSGGGAGLLAREAPAGGDVTYTFTASDPGTYLYESGSDPAKQVQMGLYGALVVRPADHPDWAYGNAATQFDPAREYILILSEIDIAQHGAVETGGTYDATPRRNRYFTINGRSFPDTLQDNGVAWLPAQPYGALVRVQPFSAAQNPKPALIRMVNAGLLNHPFHPHGNHLRMIAQDGRRFVTASGGDASTEHFAETIASGSTEDLLLTWTDQDEYSPTNTLPITIPSYNNLTFKDSDTWYSGSPYLGYKGALPSTVQTQNVCGEQYFPWHSHALNEFANYDAGFGGLATLLRVDPLGGCFSFPTSTKVLTGTAKGGSYSNLALDDASYYEVNSTTTVTPPRAAEWYAAFTGVPAGLQNLKVTYSGKNSLSCTQTVSIWKWSTSTWVQLDSRTVGATNVAIAGLAPPGAASAYRGTGASAGQLRIRVACSGPGSNFVSSGTLVKLVYDAP